MDTMVFANNLKKYLCQSKDGNIRIFFLAGKYGKIWVERILLASFTCNFFAFICGRKRMKKKKKRKKGKKIKIKKEEEARKK